MWHTGDPETFEIWVSKYPAASMIHLKSIKAYFMGFQDSSTLFVRNAG
jgi:NADPH-dependent 7-cyano-7-deazaguanine reductase QueF